jgi:hypothetical protein
MKWKEFLNPRSMLTPGIAGSMVMVIANTLWVEFMVPQKWTALVLSFVLLIPILLRFSANIFEKLIYFSFNGLIVFSLAVNTNFAGRQLQQIAAGDKEVAMETSPYKAAIASALSERENKIQIDHSIQLAQNTTNKTVTTTTIKVDGDDKKTDQPTTKKKSKIGNDKNDNKENREFFEKWF